MLARDDSHTGHPPPWVTSFGPLASSIGSASTSASSSNGADENDNGDDSTTSDAFRPSTVVTEPTTFSTSLSFASGAVDLSGSDKSLSVSTSFVTSSASPGNSMTKTPWWVTANEEPSTTPTPTSNLVQTSPILDSWSGSTHPSFTITTNPGSSSTVQGSLPNQHASDHEHKRSFNGPLLAAVIVPIILVLLIGIGVLLCLRRRRRAADRPPGVMAEVREKLFAKKTYSEPPSVAIQQVHPPQPHLIMSPQNNTYFTGLDTMSMMSAEPRDRSSEEPPPPYWPRGDSAMRSVSMRSNGRSIIPPASAFLDVPSPTSPLNRQAVPEHSPFDDPPETFRTPSFRSITSTLYSSDASVVEARPARRSIVSAHMVGEDERSPFADPDTDVDRQH